MLWELGRGDALTADERQVATYLHEKEASEQASTFVRRIPQRPVGRNETGRPIDGRSETLGGMNEGC